MGRFGPLRNGAVYRMPFYLRNLDVDIMRFNITPFRPPSDFVSVQYSPMNLASGMAQKIVVEVRAKGPAHVEQLIEIKVKAHVIRVPVTARIFDVDEFDRLDNESLMLHGRRIGRHREKPDGQGMGPVELVRDDTYSRKVMGMNYIPFPPDVEQGPLLT